jgi:hypothetical protein
MQEVVLATVAGSFSEAKSEPRSFSLYSSRLFADTALLRGHSSATAIPYALQNASVND